MRLITLAIHTYDRALAVKALLEGEGIKVTLQNVNLEQPEVSSGVRVRISSDDLPLALRIVENPEMFGFDPSRQPSPKSHRVILTPTDFSPHSMAAACVAARMASAAGASICLLNAYIDPGLSGAVQLTDDLTYDIADSEASRRIAQAARDGMDEFARQLRAKMIDGQIPMVRIDTEVVEGVPEDAIISYTRAGAPYLVVMGTRASERKERELIGSVTAEVLDECRFSVLSVPENVAAGASNSPERILFFSNLDQEDIIAMDTLYRYFPNAHARVTIIHIPRRNRFTDRAAGRSALALSEYCCNRFTHFNFESVPLSPKSALSELTRLQEEHHFDLLVVPNRRKNALSRLFNPGLAHKILFQADIPMLVIPV